MELIDFNSMPSTLLPIHVCFVPLHCIGNAIVQLFSRHSYFVFLILENGKYSSFVLDLMNCKQTPQQLTFQSTFDSLSQREMFVNNRKNHSQMRAETNVLLFLLVIVIVHIVFILWKTDMP